MGEGKGTSVFLKPSGYSGKTAFEGPEPGSNGLAIDPPMTLNRTAMLKPVGCFTPAPRGQKPNPACRPETSPGAKTIHFVHCLKHEHLSSETYNQGCRLQLT
jgi:hypothetical protein